MILAICGLGGTGREILELAKELNKVSHRWDSYIFIDKDTERNSFQGCPSMDMETALGKYAKDEILFTIALGEPYLREKVYHEVIDNGYSLATLVHPNVHIPDSTTLGQGVIVSSGSFISVDSVIEDNVLIQPTTTIAHDAYVGKHCVIASGSTIAGNCKIGEKTFIAIQSALIQGITVGKSVIVGMGAMVHADVTDEVVVLGNPARVVKKNVSHKVF